VTRRLFTLGLAIAPLCAGDVLAQTSLRQRIVVAEDARVATAEGIAPMLEGLRSGDFGLVAIAARALGRFERPAFVPHLLPLLEHAREAVRREAATALGQSLARVARRPDAPLPPELDQVARALRSRLDTETDPYVRGTIAETIGRLPYRSVDHVREAELALQRYLPDFTAAGGGQPLHPGSLTGVVKGLESLIRLNRTLRQPEPETVDRLNGVATAPLYRLDEAFIVIRRLGWLAVNAASAAEQALIERGVADADAQVRRLAIAALVTAPPAEGRDKVLQRALGDASFHVRYEAVRVYGRLLRDTDCAPLIAATRDANTHVVLGAIDALTGGCPAGTNAAAVLAAFADQLHDADARWHRAAHAIVALATVQREEAARRLEQFAKHAVWQLRAYAARAATVLENGVVLERLAAHGDSANVRYEALLGLRKLRAHAADAIYIDALEDDDYQLVLAAAEALEGSPSADAAEALIDAFARLTRQKRETSRDTRVALVTRLRELGSDQHAPALQDCLRDFDPVVAAECAATIEKWTGTRPAIRPEPERPEPVSASLPLRARVVMRRGGSFDLAMYVDDAPASVSRFARLVRDKYYDGLTFHRVLPNFIIQGGSPGANEYSGDGPFMRDELGLRSHVRGSIGVSTRGRDTGDAQFYINLLDNPRLDHEYTVFAEVVSGMDIVDGILEGDVIDRIELR
jgi:cyclophilin family peptidyl-prolyl cis-trans isomerase/HEAT repeat protein